MFRAAAEAGIKQGQRVEVIGAAGGAFSSIAGMPGPPMVQTLRPLVAMAEAGKYRVTVTRRFALGEAGAAWEHLRTSEGVGKTVLIVDAVRAGQR